MIINPSQFDFEQFKKIPAQKRRKGNQGNKHKISYKDIVTAFDIETTTIDEIEQAVMYVWQWQFGNDITVIGRTWREFLDFKDKLEKALDGMSLVVYVFNLSFEFQFLRGIYNFNEDEVFCMDNRKILKCSMDDEALEFRCAYLHSGMSLKIFLKEMKVEHQKLDGDIFDYSKKRYSWTPLDPIEMEYAVNDVLGLVEAIQVELTKDGDSLYTIPLTKTGYVRREAKKAMRLLRHDYIKGILPDFYTYILLREAFRGGNTHANRLYANTVIDGVTSADRSSSYPDVLCNCEFPISRFVHRGAISTEEFEKLCFERHRAMILKVALWGVKLTDRYFGCPYLSKDKCRQIDNGVFDNGRILSADYLETTITDVDFKIILSEYSWEDIEIFDSMHARYGKLPKPFTDLIIDFYEKKTSLKGDPNNEYIYGKSKAMLNSLYGMCAMNPVKYDIKFRNGEFVLDESKLGADILEEYNKKAFLPYQWGVWCTAWARYRLEEGIRLAGNKFVYCDTDSVKYVGDINWNKYNRERKRDSVISGAKAKDSKGQWHYMGVYEPDGEYSEFITMGAKKYAYVEDGKLHVTVSGVNKTKGAAELGDIHNFKEDFIFSDAGGTESVYNDNPSVKSWNIDGHNIDITSNIVIKNSTYTLGITEEYSRIINFYQFAIDRHYKI